MLIWGGGNTVFIILCTFLNYLLFYFENKGRKGNWCPRMFKQNDYSAEWPNSLGRDNNHLHHKGNGQEAGGVQSHVAVKQIAQTAPVGSHINRTKS